MTNSTICRFYIRGKNSFLLVILILLSSQCFAQSSTGKTPIEKQLIRKAYGQWRKANFTKALFLYQKAIALNPSNSYTNFQVGAIYFITDSVKDKSLPYFRNTIKYAPPIVDDTIIDAYYYMAYCYMLEEKYDSSAICFKKYKGHLDEVKGNKEAFEEMKRNLEVCKMAPDIIKRAPDSTAYLISGKPQPTYITNVGTSVNSPFSEYSQLLYEKDSVMVFTSRRPESQNGKIDELTGRYYEDTYISKKGNNGKWSSPEPFTQELHIPPKKLNMATVAVSNDGNTLYIYKGGSIMQSGRTNGAWSEPQNLSKKVKDFKKYYIPSIFVSEDGTRLILVSDKKGGQGGRDLYMCMKDGTGNWSEPKNMGPEINSAEDEDAPYLMPDNKTLFFSSRGHGGLGGYDIFVSHYGNGAWGQPQNLGVPINSPADDIYFSYNDDEKKGYFSSSRINGSGDMDIYSFAFTCDDIENTSLKGKVLAQGEKPNVNIQITDLSSKIAYSPAPVKVDENGSYSVKLKPGHKYHMGVTSEGYLPYSIDFSTPHQCNAFNLYQIIRMSGVDDSASTHIGQKLLVKNAFYRSVSPASGKNAKSDPEIASLTKVYKDTDAILETDTSVAIAYTPDEIKTMNPQKIQISEAGKTKASSNIIYFEIESSDIDARYHTTLNTVISALKENKEMKVMINGYSDNTGKHFYNKRLSTWRAANVAKYLHAHGIRHSRISYEGLGDSGFVAANDGEHNYLNRRVEVIFVK